LDAKTPPILALLLTSLALTTLLAPLKGHAAETADSSSGLSLNPSLRAGPVLEHIQEDYEHQTYLNNRLFWDGKQNQSQWQARQEQLLRIENSRRQAVAEILTETPVAESREDRLPASQDEVPADGAGSPDSISSPSVAITRQPSTVAKSAFSGTEAASTPPERKAHIYMASPSMIEMDFR